MMPQLARASDAAELADLDARCFDAAERWTQPLWQAELEAADRCVLVQRDHSANHGGLVAAASFQNLFETTDLLRVMVASTHRGLGLAQQLLRAGIEWSLGRGAERMLLEVRHDNTAAINLYERLGFTAIDRRANYYGPGLDAVVMQTVLRTGAPR